MGKVKMMSFVKRPVSVFLVLISSASFAEESCFNLSIEPKISIGLTIENSEDNKSIEQSFSKYITAVKSNDKKSILLSITPFDGSRASVNKGLLADPARFSNYKGIDKAAVSKELISWGNYKFFYVDYEFRGKEVSLGESLYCTSSSCLASNIFEDERRDKNISLVSRVMYSYKNKIIQPVSCDDVKSNDHHAVELYPSAVFDKSNPIIFYIDKKADYKKILNRDQVDQLVKSNNINCFNLLNKPIEAFESDEEILRTVTEFVEGCSVKTEKNSLIPVSFQDSKVLLTKYLTPYSYISRLMDTSSIEVKMKFLNGNGRVILVLKLTSNEEDSLLVMPLQEGSKGRMMFDWSFYSSLPGELLTNSVVLDSLRLLR